METQQQQLRRHVLAKTGLAFEISHGVDGDGDCWYLLQPEGYPADHAFGIRMTVGWRHVGISFELGTFAGDLVACMGKTDITGQTAFRATLRECSNRGATIKFCVNGLDLDDGAGWPDNWTHVSISLRSNLMPVEGSNDLDFGAAVTWTARFAAAILALLPVEDQDDVRLPGASGYEEGGASIQRVTRYERDRRNRAAAIAIWGASCKACEINFESRYGSVAAGFIEVHHTTPVSVLEPGTVVDPARDLVPLCPNCHAVVHRRDPPFSVDEVRDMVRSHA